MKYNFTFTGEEANIILQALSERPFKEVHRLIAKILENAKEQEKPKQVNDEKNPPDKESEGSETKPTEN